MRKKYVSPKTTIERYDIGDICVYIAASQGDPGEDGEARKRGVVDDEDDYSTISHADDGFSSGVSSPNSGTSGKKGWGSLW